MCVSESLNIIIPGELINAWRGNVWRLIDCFLEFVAIEHE